jgi:hypothetical protein
MKTFQYFFIIHSNYLTTTKFKMDNLSFIDFFCINSKYIFENHPVIFFDVINATNQKYSDFFTFFSSSFRPHIIPNNIPQSHYYNDLYFYTMKLVLVEYYQNHREIMNQIQESIRIHSSHIVKPSIIIEEVPKNHKKKKIVVHEPISEPSPNPLSTMTSKTPFDKISKQEMDNFVIIILANLSYISWNHSELFIEIINCTNEKYLKLSTVLGAGSEQKPAIILNMLPLSYYNKQLYDYVMEVTIRDYYRNQQERLRTMIRDVQQHIRGSSASSATSA